MFLELETRDWFCCTDVAGVAHKASGAQFKALIVPPLPLKITVPHVAEHVGGNVYEVTTEATVEGGVPPYSREWVWELFGSVDSNIPVEGTDEDRVNGTQPDRPYFARTSGDDCLVAFSKQSVKNATFVYKTLDGEDWELIYEIRNTNMKGGKFWEGTYWCCTAGDGGAGLHLITIDSETGNHDKVYKNIAQIASGGPGSGDVEALFNVDFNPVTGTVMLGGYRVLYRANYLSDPDLTQITRIPNSGFEYSRGLVCDPNTNEWWYGNNKGEVFYSDDDGKTWTKQSFTYYTYTSSSPVESNELFIDSEYVYFSVASKKHSGRFKRDNSGVVEVDSEWSYCNTNDKKTIVKTGHGKKYYAKGYYGDTWNLAYDEVVSFPGKENKPIILHTPFTTGMWLTVCEGDVVVKDTIPSDTPNTGPDYAFTPDPEVKSIQCTEIVTDKVLATDQVTIPVAITINP